MMGQRRSKGGTSLRKFRAGAEGRFSSIEVSQRPLILPDEWLSLIELPIHDRYDITVPATPVIAVEKR